MRYKVGDRVKIKKDLKADVQYGSKGFTNLMCKHRGKETTIAKVLSNFYTLKVDNENWSWSEEMLEPVVNCDFKVGDKVIFNPAEKDKLVGVFTVSEIDMDLGIPYIKLKEVKECMWFDPNRFLKVPVFKVGNIVTFKNIEDDKYFCDTSTMRSINGQPGVIMGIEENQYTVDKPGQDGCKYEIKQFRTGCTWRITSASIEPILAFTTLDDIKIIAADDPGPKGDLGVIVDGRALAIAQAVDNVKAPQFHIGDKVIINSNLVSGNHYDDGIFFNEDMKPFKRKKATVVEIDYWGTQILYKLDIDNQRWSWSPSMLLPYSPGSDYDLDKEIINQQKTKQQYANRLQEKGPSVAGGKECSECGIRYPRSKASIRLGHIRDKASACKC